MNRGLTAQINLSAFKNNYSCAQQLAPNSKTLAVVKADAYGHGAVACAKALSNADGFGVASLQEAVVLRQSGISQKIIVMSGVASPDEVADYLHWQLDYVVHSQWQWLALFQFQQRQAKTYPWPLLWLKIETGMHRLGLTVSQLQALLPEIEKVTPVKPVIMSHFASADDAKHRLNTQQLDFFSGKDAVTSLANSAALINFPDARGNWNRPGIMLYGSNPTTSALAQLQAVMTLTARVIAIKAVGKGSTVGYGATWQASKDSIIAVVAAGYADGYPREVDNSARVMVNGVSAPITGRVSMDLLSVDVSNFAVPVKVGDKVELWGEQLDVDSVAQFSNTISYTLLTGVNARVPRVYLEKETQVEK